MNTLKQILLFTALFISALWVFSSCSEEDATEATTIEVSSITISGKDIAVNESLQLEAEVLPENASNKNVIWSISDESLAMVSSEGVLKAIRKGKVVVSALAQDGSKVVGIKEINIGETGSSSPGQIPGNKVLVSSITVEAPNITGGSISQANVKVLPESATNQKVTWTVSDNFVASIDENGKLTARKNGTVTITATAQDGSKITGSKEIIITDWKANGFTFNSKTYLTSQVYLRKFTILGGGYVLYFYPSAYKLNGLGFFTGVGNHIQVGLVALEDEDIEMVPAGDYQEFDAVWTEVNLGHDANPSTIRTDEAWSVARSETDLMSIEEEDGHYKITYSITFYPEDGRATDDNVRVAEGYYEGEIIFLE